MANVLKHVDLCSGIGGFALGFEWAELSQPVLFCDNDKWCRDVLRKNWPNVPIAENVKDLAHDAAKAIPDCDIITAGYPCQPFSVAGQRKGTEDDRHIWPYIAQIVAQKRPSWCVFENVYGHLSMGLDEVLFDLEAEGYAARPYIVPAIAVDAPHRRDRIWIVARNMGDTYRKQRRTAQGNRELDLDGAILDRRKGAEKTDALKGSSSDLADASIVQCNGSTEHSQQSKRQKPEPGNDSSAESMADAYRDGRQGQRSERHHAGSTRLRSGKAQRTANFWLSEPDVGRVANGIPKRVDRLRGLGNAIVPHIAKQIGTAIKLTED